MFPVSQKCSVSEIEHRSGNSIHKTEREKFDASSGNLRAFDPQADRMQVVSYGTGATLQGSWGRRLLLGRRT